MSHASTSAPGHPFIQTTGDPATPALGVYLPNEHRMYWLLTEQQIRIGNSGFVFEESDDRTTATMYLTAPCIRENRQGMCGQVPSEDAPAPDWQPGDDIVLHLRWYCAPAHAVHDLFDRFVDIRKDLTGPVTLRHILPFSAAWAIHEEKYNAGNWNEEGGYYSVGMRENMGGDYQAGWVGGGMVTMALLFAGNDTSRARAKRTLETIFLKRQAPSGFLYGIGNAQVWYGDSFGAEPHPRRMHLVRKSADMLYFALKQCMLLEKMGESIPVPIRAAIRRLADAFVRLWECEGQFGQFVDVETG